MAMHRAPWTLLLLGLPVFLDALVVKSGVLPTIAVDLLEETANPGQALDLLEKEWISKKKEQKKWNWKQASEESKTEWAIVLKRYVLADMTVYELSRHFGEALPSTAGPTTEDQRDALGWADKKLARLTSNLERAVLDQNTSDATAVDMQIARKTNLLTVHEKRLLADEHKREQYGFFAIEASGQDVLQKAAELLQILQAEQAQPTKAQPSWSSIVAAPAAPATPKTTYLSMLNATQAVPTSAHNNATAIRGAKPTAAALFQNFEDAAKVLHREMGNFESMRAKSIASLLAMPSMLQESTSKP